VDEDEKEAAADEEEEDVLQDATSEIGGRRRTSRRVGSLIRQWAGLEDKTCHWRRHRRLKKNKR
jgi:hypothetical protein